MKQEKSKISVLMSVYKKGKSRIFKSVIRKYISSDEDCR